MNRILHNVIFFLRFSLSLKNPIEFVNREKYYLQWQWKGNVLLFCFLFLFFVCSLSTQNNIEYYWNQLKWKRYRNSSVRAVYFSFFIFGLTVFLIMAGWTIHWLIESVWFHNPNASCTTHHELFHSFFCRSSNWIFVIAAIDSFFFLRSF